MCFRSCAPPFIAGCSSGPRFAPDEARAPRVLAVGDLHVENFGTWRDVEGRLVWGINDFDEAYELPYTIDLVRLAASAHIAIRESRLEIAAKDACDAILAGYKKGLEMGGVPFVLAEEHDWLRQMVTGILRDPVQYWEKLDSLPTLKGRVPKSARRAIDRLTAGARTGLPDRSPHRRSGQSGARALRRDRDVSRRGEWRAKPRLWPLRRASGPPTERSPSASTIRRRWTVRCATSIPSCACAEDGSSAVSRPIARASSCPPCPRNATRSKLLRAMGFETANVHLGTPRAAKAILRDLGKRPVDWLHEAATAMVKATTADWREWRTAARRKPAKAVR